MDVDMSASPDPNNEQQPAVGRNQTFVAAPANDPVGLDVSAFDRPQRQDQDMPDATPQKSDTEVINECLQKHVTFSNVMQRRLENTTTVLNYILKNNDMQAAINAMNTIKDVTVTMDVLASTFAKNKRMEMLNFQKVSKVLPLVQELIESKYETHNKCGLGSALNILKAF